MESETSNTPLPLPAPVQSAGVLPYASTPDPPLYASFGSRLGAWFIDLLILMGIRFVVTIVLGLIMMAVESGGFRSEMTDVVLGWIAILVLYGVGWAYYAFSETSSKQVTLGKSAMGLQVEDVDGGPATLMQVSMRFFMRLVSTLLLGIGFLLPLFTSRHQALHDIAANCVVTQRKGPLPK